MSIQVRFPQSPMVGPDGNLSLEWQQWLLNPQVLTVTFSVALDVTSGGTGLVSGTSGGILGFTGTTTMASSALLTQHALVLGGGAGATPSTPVGLGTTSQVLHGNATGAPSFGAVVLTTDVSGILPVANGGTGSSSATLVPYTGATSDVDLGTHNFTTTGTIGGGATTVTTVTTSAPTGGAGTWKLGVANVVSPTSPNRTVTIDIGGTTYYLAAKTTND